MPRASRAADGANVTRHEAAGIAAALRRLRRRRRRRRADDGGEPRDGLLDRRRRGRVAPARAMVRSSASTPAIERVDAVGVSRASRCAQRAQVALHVVREHFGVAQLDHAGDALDRMEAAEQLFEHRRRRPSAAAAGSSASSSRRIVARCSSHSAK